MVLLSVLSRTTKLILWTCVGEPASPMLPSVAPMSSAVQMGIFSSCLVRKASRASSVSNSGRAVRSAVYSLDVAASLSAIRRRTDSGRGVLAEPTTVSRQGSEQRTISEPWSRARWAVILPSAMSMMVSA